KQTQGMDVRAMASASTRFSRAAGADPGEASPRPRVGLARIAAAESDGRGACDCRWRPGREDAGKLSLSMVPPREDIEAASNDVSGFVGVDASQWLEGTVLSFAEFGAFVQVAPPSGGAPPTKGLLHKSQMGNGNMPDDPQEVLEIGQAIQVRVVKVDEERQRIQLSMQ
ncbi:unnamed protein product, partial [Prorocentrum cordatum]